MKYKKGMEAFKALEDWLTKTVTPDSEVWGYWLQIQTMLGEVSEEVAEKSAEVEKLREALALCISNAGHPDASQACRNVIQTAKTALEEIK